jgi:hypothetical protein
MSIIVIVIYRRHKLINLSLLRSVQNDLGPTQAPIQGVPLLDDGSFLANPLLQVIIRQSSYHLTPCSLDPDDVK